MYSRQRKQAESIKWNALVFLSLHITRLKSITNREEEQECMYTQRQKNIKTIFKIEKLILS